MRFNIDKDTAKNMMLIAWTVILAVFVYVTFYKEKAPTSELYIESLETKTDTLEQQLAWSKEEVLFIEDKLEETEKELAKKQYTITQIKARRNEKIDTIQHFTIDQFWNFFSKH